MVAGMVSREHEFYVLVVDDSAVDRKLIKKLLKTSSFRVTVVDSPEKALRFLGLQEDEEKENANRIITDYNSMEINLIITDYSMPGMTGFDLMRKVKESSSCVKEIPVVVMSSENETGRRCLEQGAHDFFLKPVKQSDVNKLRSQLVASSHSKWSISIMKPGLFQ